MSRVCFRVLPGILLFVFSVSVTLGFQLLLPSNYYNGGSSDFALRDLPMAYTLSAGKLVLNPGKIPAPGFPLVLGGLVLMTQQLNLALDGVLRAFAIVEMAITTVLLWLLAQLLWNRSRALVAALLWSTFPFALWLTEQTTTELSFMVFFLAGLWVFGVSLSNRASRVWLLLAGCSVGFAILIRPGALGLGLILMGGLFCLQTQASLGKRLWLGLVLLVGIGAVVMPWEYVVWRQTGRWILITTNDVASLRDGLTFGLISKGYRDPLVLPSEVEDLMQDATEQLPQLQSLSDIWHFGVAQARVRPWGLVQFMALKAVRSWYGTDSQRYEFITLMTQLGYLCLAMLGMYGMWRSPFPRRAFGLLLLVMVAYFWFITFLVLPILRYMIPAMAILMIMIPGILDVFPLKWVPGYGRWKWQSS